MSRTHNRQPMVHRMARIEGHVHAVREMLISDRDCPEICKRQIDPTLRWGSFASFTWRASVPGVS